MDVPLVNTFMGGDGAKNQDENWEEALRVWPDIVAFAERPRPQDHASRTARCCSRYDEWPGGNNIATTPRMWRRILEQWGGTIGLNFDPSHLILQMIDIPRFIREFGPHILHVQAKDLMIDRDGLYERGVFSMGMGWQVPRLPGLGEVDWGVVFGALCRPGYDGDCIIEHEDRGFERTDELVKRGFLIARDVLRPYISERRSDLDHRSTPDRARHREDDRPLACCGPELDDAFVEDGCRLRGRVRRRVGLRAARSTSAGRRRSSPAPTSRSGRSIGFPHGSHDRDEGRSRRGGRSTTARPSSTWSSRSAR